MAAEIVARGRAGKIIIRDHREDGTIIVLVCEEFEPTDGGGIIIPRADDDEDDGPYPMLVQRGIVEESFTLEVDTTAMSGGLQVFTSREFLEQALETAAQGVRRVSIDFGNSERWGHRRPTETSQGSPRIPVR
jgi:hypothetical protein